MKFLSLNCQSFSTAKSDLNNIVDTYDIDILCLSETWEQKDKKLTFKNWKIDSKARSSDNHGGVAICSKQSEHFMIERVKCLERDEVEAICTEIVLKTGEKTLLIVTYIPPNKLDQLKALVDLIKNAQTLYSNLIVTGDFNAKSKSWGNTVENSAGDILEDYLCDSGCGTVLINDGLPTRRNCDSVIDLVLVSTPIVKKITKCQTLSHENVRSDHIAILMNLDDGAKRNNDEFIHKFLLHKTDWEMWNNETTEEFAKWIAESKKADNLDVMYESFLETFKGCMEKCVPKIKVSLDMRRRNQPWLNEEVKGAKNSLNAAKKHYKRRMTPTLLKELQEKDEEYKKCCESAKSDWVERTCKVIDTCKNPKEKWRAFHKLTSYEEPDGGVILPLIDEDGHPKFDHKSKCDILQKTFFGGDHLKAESFDDNFRKQTENKFSVLKQKCQNNTEEDFLNRRISSAEVEASIQKLENGKAAGPDEVFTDLLKKCNPVLLEAITLLFQQSFEKGQLPRAWKKANVKFIQKPGKDNYYLPGSYRPISLTSSLGKCLERVIKSRMYAFAEHNELLDIEQEGFRERRSTTHAMLRLSEDIWKGFAEGDTTIAVFVDIEKAFDSVWREALLVKLEEMGFKGKMWNWLQNFLDNREAVCCMNNFKSEAHVTHMGLPQGSVLSPLLFNLYLSDIFKEVKGQKVKFADDGTIWQTGKNITDIETILQNDLIAISAWTKKWRMKLNTSKTECCVFSREKIDDDAVSLSLNGEIITRTKEAKMLGVYFDEKMTFQTHLQKAAIKASKAVSLLGKVAKCESISVESMLKLYRSLVVPHLEYASPVWRISPHTKTLNKIQRQGLMLCLGGVGSASLESLEVQANVLPLDIRREDVAIRECTKILAKPSSSLVKKSVQYCQVCLEDGVNTHSPMSSMLELVKEMEVVTDIDTKCLETEFSYLEYLQPTRHRPSYWNNLGSSKSRTKEQEAQGKMKIRELVADLPEDTLVAFTDGSCKGNPGPCGAGSCVFLPSGECIELKQPVSKLASILVGELVAIKITLEQVVIESQKKPVRMVQIFSDSQTAIGVLTLGWECNSHTLLVQEIRRLWKQLEQAGSSIRLDWTPGHADIEGNERADRLAKDAAIEAEQMENEAAQPLSQTDIKKAAKQMALYKWQRRWDISEKGRHLYSLKKCVGGQQVAFEGCRNQRSLLQLQNGHCRLKDHLFTVGMSDDPCCECGERETTEHFLLACPLYEGARENMIASLLLSTEIRRQHINTHVLLTSSREEEDLEIDSITISRYVDEYMTRSGRFLC